MSYHQAKTLLSRVSLKMWLLLVVAIAALAFAIPNINNISNADTVGCTPTYTQPTFNAYPVSYNHPVGQDCHEFPLVQGRSASTPFPRNEGEFAAGVTAGLNQEVLVQSWIHNSATPGSGKLFNVKYKSTIDTGTGANHSVSVQLSADNATSRGSSFAIHTPANARLEVVPGSGTIYDYQGNVIESGLDIGNNTIEIGDMKACWDFAHFVSFKVRVVETVVYTTPQTQTGCVDVIKETYDTLGNPLTPVAQFTFKLDNNQTVTNDGSGRARFTNVPPGSHTVTEILPSGWNQVSVAPVNGVVQVNSGATCAVVVFKNKQNITQYSTPYSSPYASPYATPYVTPYNTPYGTPYSTPYVTPYKTPYATP